jgi:hypothetical protein
MGGRVFGVPELPKYSPERFISRQMPAAPLTWLHFGDSKETPVFIGPGRILTWLSDMDSNHDYGLQRPVCYHYTIGHGGTKLVSRPRSAKIFLGLLRNAARKRQRARPG